MPRRHIDDDATTEHRTELEQNHSALALAYLAVGALIPTAFTIDDLMFHRSGWYLNYAGAALILGLEALYVVANRNSGRWKNSFLGLVALGVPLAVLAPISRFIEVLVFLASTPLAFQFKGPRKGLFWMFLLVAEFAVLCAGSALGWLPDWLAKYPWPLVPVLFATFVVVGALSWSLTYVHDRSYRRIVDADLYDAVSRLPRTPLLLRELERPRAGRHWLVLIRWENHSELHRILGDRPQQAILTRIRLLFDALGSQAFQTRPAEFAVLLGQESVNLEQLHDALEALDFAEGGLDFRLLVTLGAVPLGSGSPREILTWANQALATALRNHAAFFVQYRSRDTSDAALKDIERHALLSRSIEKELLEVWFQPIFRASDLEPAWHEALLRVRRPDSLDSIYPYLPVAEASGLMPKLAQVVLTKAAAFVDATGGSVSVNLSLQDLHDEAVLRRILELVEHRPPGSFLLEILERDPLTNVQGVPEFVKKVRKAGCRIALDDFGSGYSNFGPLVSLDLDVVKIDGSLVQRSLADPKAMALVEALIQFCRKAKLPTVAEHIDTPHLAETFRRLGVDYLQGFHLGEPRPFTLA